MIAAAGAALVTAGHWWSLTTDGAPPSTQPAAGSGQGPEWGEAAPIGLLIILLMGGALFLLIKSMNRNLRRVPASFDEPAKVVEPEVSVSASRRAPKWADDPSAPSAAADSSGDDADPADAEGADGDLADGDRASGDAWDADPGDGDRVSGDASDADRADGDLAEGDRATGDASDADRADGDRADGGAFGGATDDDRRATAP